MKMLVVELCQKVINEKKNKGDFTLSFSGNKTKKDEIYLWDKEYIEFEKTYACKKYKKKEDTVMVEYTYTNEMGIKKKQEVTAQLKKELARILFGMEIKNQYDNYILIYLIPNHYLI